jgi:Gpi18-like mannosyltransferase
LQPFLRFDATYYQSLWQSGYSGPLVAYHAAFYPVYPLLVRAIGILLGPELAAVLISNAAFLAALILIYKVAIRHLEPAVASRSLWILALWPWAIFYSYGYAESVELLLVAAAFLLMERGAWIWSGVVAALAGASRPSGILTSLAFAGELVERLWAARFSLPRWRGRVRVGDRGSLARVMIGGLLSPLGLVAFCLILLIQTGNPFACGWALIRVTPCSRSPQRCD